MANLTKSCEHKLMFKTNLLTSYKYIYLHI